MKRKSVVALTLGALTVGSLALLAQKKKQDREKLRITSPDGIDQEEYVYIGGIEQYLYHRGKNTANPVVLFLHGGPGSPEVPFLHKFQLAWEDRVTVVHWDQRGAGKTFFHNGGPDAATTNMERLIEDTDEIVSYLKRKYNKEKIILLGHSWGSVLGSAYVKRYPQSVLAYIGVGQVVSMVENERLGYQKVLETAQAAGNQKDVRKLEALAPYPGEFAHFMKTVGKVRSIQCKYKLATGYTLENIAAVGGSPFYSLWESTFFFRPDAMKGQIHIFENLFDFDVNTLGTEYRVPFFIIQGEEDWQTPFSLAEAFSATIHAPQQGFYPIPEAGHFTMNDQQEQFTKTLFAILDRLEEPQPESDPPQ